MISLAHGLGGRHDLPVPAFYAFAGAFAALLISFLALGLLWSRSRFRGDRAGKPVPHAVQRAADAPATRRLLRAAGLGAFLFTLAVALAGSPDPARNPAPGLLYAVLWTGLVPLCLLLGPVWRLVDPLRTLHALGCRLRGRDPAAGARELPARLGHWPAAAGLLAFAWTELASPQPAAPATVAAFMLGYSAVQLAGAARYGTAWFDRCDPFTVYSGLIGSLAPLGRRRDGRLVLRLPFHGLDAVPALPGLTATVCVLLGSTGYDGFTTLPQWVRLVQSGPLDPTLTRTLGLLTTIALVAALFAVCASARYAHTLIPIAVGYLIAHYLTLLLAEGPRTFLLVAHVLGVTDGLPGAAVLPVDPGTVAAVQVLAVIAGHVVGVVAAHDRAVRLMPPERAVAGQVPLLILMVCYTLGGLGLLFAA